MGLRVVGLGLGMGVGALLAVGGVGAQTIAMQGDPMACATVAGPLMSVCAAAPADSQAGSNLPPVATLLRHGMYTRPARDFPASDTDWWAGMVERAQRSFTAMTSKLATAARASLAERDSAVVGRAQPARFARSTPAIERFLIDEWQQSEVAVADSVYHETLQRITATFDSTERAQVHDPDRTRILQHLDAMLIATNNTWVAFRTQIAERADSALANDDPSVPRTK
jgi:hypothetical protein